MTKHEPSSTLAFGSASDAGLAGRRPVLGEIGFVGLGHMGMAMAANLISAGRRVIAYIRRPDQIAGLEAPSLRTTTDFSDLLDCKVVISMLPDDNAVREIVCGRKDIGLGGLAAGLMPGAIHLSMSTISTAAAVQLASEHARNGQGYVAAPVFGNPDAAKARQPFIVAAGAPADVERCQPILDNLGQRTFVIGTEPADANLVKLLGNMMSATALEMLGEVVAVVRKRGLDPQPFIDIMTSTMFGGRAHKIYGDKIAELRGGICTAACAQGRAPGACGSRESGRPDAIGGRGPGSVDHGNRARLRRARLDGPRAYRRGGSRTLRRAVRHRQMSLGLSVSHTCYDGCTERRKNHG